MSIESAKTFYKRLSTDEAFRKQLQNASNDERVEFIQAAGYDFTWQEWEIALTQISKSEDNQLPDPALEVVAGGKGGIVAEQTSLDSKLSDEQIKAISTGREVNAEEQAPLDHQPHSKVRSHLEPAIATIKRWYQRVNPAAWPIKTKLTVALLSVALIPIGLNAYFNLQRSIKIVEENEYRKLELSAASNASRLDQQLLNLKNVVIQVSADPNVVDFLASTNTKPENPGALPSTGQQPPDKVTDGKVEDDPTVTKPKKPEDLRSSGEQPPDKVTDGKVEDSPITTRPENPEDLRSARQQPPDKVIDGKVEDDPSATRPENPKGLRATVQQTLDNVKRSNPDYESVCVINKVGRCIASTETVSVGDNHTSRDYFQQAIQGKPYVSGVLVGQARGEPGVFFSSPVRSSSGEILGVAVLKIQGKTLWSTVNQVRADSHSQAFLVDENGIIINHPNESFLYNSLTPLPPNTLKQLASERNYSPDQMKSLNLPKLAAAMLRAREPGHISYYFSREQMYLTVGFAPVEVKPWVLGVSKPKANFAAPLNQLIVQEVSSVLVVGAIAAIIALLLAQSVARPIRALTQAAEALVYETEFDHQALAKASLMRDDVGQLVRVFLNMAQAVKTREQKLQQQVDALELRIEIDESKRAQQVAEITETDYFQDVQKEVQKLKTQPAKADETNTDFFEEMREKAQQLKDRTPKAES